MKSDKLSILQLKKNRLYGAPPHSSSYVSHLTIFPTYLSLYRHTVTHKETHTHNIDRPIFCPPPIPYSACNLKTKILLEANIISLINLRETGNLSVRMLSMSHQQYCPFPVCILKDKALQCG